MGAETNPWLQAGLIYDWIAGSFRYQVPGPEGRDANSVLEAGHGDCEQFSILMVAMCRSLGIPARTVSGLRPFERGVGRLEQFGERAAWFERTLDVHVWIEVYLPTVGWVQGEPDMPGFGVDKERLITKRGPFSFPGGLCQQATYFHLPLAVQGDWCGQSVGWEVSVDAQTIE